jgi:hypothetical protein
MNVMSLLNSGGCKMDRKYEIEGKLIDLSVQVLDLVKKIQNDRKAFFVAKALLQNAVPPVICYGEALLEKEESLFRMKLLDCLSYLKGIRDGLIITARSPQKMQFSDLGKMILSCNYLISVISRQIKPEQAYTHQRA